MKKSREKQRAEGGKGRRAADGKIVAQSCLSTTERTGALVVPRAGAPVVVVAPLFSLRILRTASASGWGWGCWREPKWNSKWKNVSRFAAQAALKEIIFSYKQTHTRTQHTHTPSHTHRHTRTDTHALTYTHITHTPRSTILLSWQHIQSGKKQQQKSFHRLPFYIKKLKQTNRKIKAKKQKKPSCALYWLRLSSSPRSPVINYRYHHRTQVSGT